LRNKNRNKKLKTQLTTILNILSEYRPDLCLKILDLDCLNDFHHKLWEMPFYKKIYKMPHEKMFFIKNDIYYEIGDRKLFFDEYLIVIDVWILTQVEMFGKNLKYKIKNSIITPDDNDFEFYFKNMVISNPVPLNELDGIIKNKIIDDLLM